MKQADDFRAESETLEKLLAPLSEADYARTTLFKGWTIDQILRHLHIWNRAAYLQLTDEATLKDYLAKAMGPIGDGSLTRFEYEHLNGLSGKELFETWRDFYPKLATAYSEADPSQRLTWAGPSMSARSSITARLMETWAHAQAIYDELGIDRESTDGIDNIVVLGLNTYGWTFANRKLPVPEPRPKLVLTSPSGALWEFGDEAGNEWIEGSAEEFCQVVTQCRNVADTALKVTGPNATEWMRMAQCFAGPPNDPPSPGARHKKQK